MSSKAKADQQAVHDQQQVEAPNYVQAAIVESGDHLGRRMNDYELSARRSEEKPLKRILAASLQCKLPWMLHGYRNTRGSSAAEGDRKECWYSRSLVLFQHPSMPVSELAVDLVDNACQAIEFSRLWRCKKSPTTRS